MTRTPILALLMLSSLTGSENADPVIGPQSPAPTYHFPRWSPDGKWILVSGNPDGDDEVYLLAVAGSARVKLTDNSGSDGMARWTANGSRIVFETDRRGTMETFTMKADGTDPRPAPADSVGSVHPSGEPLLFESAGRIFAMNRARTRAVPLISGKWAEQGAFSPDGTRLVFEQRQGDPNHVERSNIVVARADGAEPKAVAEGTDPSWSPDGRTVLFKSLLDGSLWITVVPAGGGTARRLALGVHPHWSPDGRRIAFMRPGAAGRWDIGVMDRDGSGARCLTCAR